MVCVKSNYVGPSPVEMSRGMSQEIIQELHHFMPTKVKGADNIYRKQSGGISKDFSFEYTAHAQTAQTCLFLVSELYTDSCSSKTIQTVAFQ